LNTKTIFELLHESSKSITSEIELEKVVQRVTDIGTELSGAQFGAFFYNVINRDGENLVLYTISGVAKEAFSKFPMPRNTKIFEPTFTASGTVRYHDVTKEPHYGKNPPYEGMPKGHLPVRSYLAVPVINPFTKEAIGGLFFGHSDAGVFSEESEKLIEGVAIQAAIAVGNARLFEEKNKAERKLLEQKEQYESIFNATSDSIIIYNEQGFIVEANPTACRVFGYPYQELIGLHAGKLYLDVKDFEALKEIALSGRQYNGINTRVRKDGSRLEVEFKGSYFIFRGKPHVMSVLKDITSGKEVEKALQRSEEMANIISSVSPVVLWMTDNQGVTNYINQTWYEWVGDGGSKKSEWILSVLPEDQPTVRQIFQTAFSARKVFTFDFRIRRRNGEVRWCSTHGSPFYNSDGNFGGYAGSLTDITERKQAEEKLQSQNALINTITNNTQQALLLMDVQQRCTYMNPAAEEMTGFKLHEVQDKALHYYVHHTHPDGRHFPIEECPIDRALPTKHQTQGEEVFIHKRGHFYPVAFTASPIIDNGVPVGTVIEARNTTEEKKIQEELRMKEKQALSLLEEKVKERTSELEKSNYELLQFTSVASHDLKEPVRKISIFSRMLREKVEPSLEESSKRYLNTIIDSSERMATLIDDLLSFSRLSHTHVEFETVDLKALVCQIIDDLEIPIKEKGAKIQLGNLPQVNGIAFQLGQVFQNLISNSLKFSATGRPLHITIDGEDTGNGPGRTCRIIYRDNGIGFKEEQAEKIFEIFHRLHSRDKFEGTGVGLAIVKKIISLHNGTIRAIGKENEGAEFLISLPQPTASL
jgi:PAS domain S-box-containing protein